MVIQLPAHHTNVYSVIADINKPNIIYSCGADKNLNCFDIKLQKRVNTHSIKNGVMYGIVQKLQSEYEISKLII